MIVGHQEYLNAFDACKKLLHSCFTPTMKRPELVRSTNDEPVAGPAAG
jgi:hypothetical protein